MSSQYLNASATEVMDPDYYINRVGEFNPPNGRLEKTVSGTVFLIGRGLKKRFLTPFF